MAVVDMSRIAVRSRYGKASDARPPSDGLPRRKPNRNVPTVIAAVVDPWGNGRERIQATVNRRTDVLETELSHGRISEAAYEAGTKIQAVVERASSVGGSSWSNGDRVDATSCHEAQVGHGVENARRVRALADNVAAIVGVIDMRLIRRIIGDRVSFEACAALEGKAGERGTRYVACRFRDALEEIAKAWAAKGNATGEVLSGSDDRPGEVAIEADTAKWASLGAGAAGRVGSAEAR